WQRGGGGHFSMPARWTPSLTVQVDWTTGVAYDPSPGFSDWPKYLAWERKIDAQTRHLSKVIPVPEYRASKTCGVTVHFLPCDEVQITTSCYVFGSSHYPIKTPLNLPEPQSCPATGHSPTGDAS
ncbi:DUF3304 domain-containing protein, partial [Pseudomonas huaxiensis]|uniref:DUF3304 domain-containing protein n=1 Tax=Pseudomonas huaxiensis TaxID=2213017 RepID=UPI0013006732